MKLSKDESQAIIDSINHSSMQVAMDVDLTIADHLEKWADQQPEKSFITYNQQQISYQQINSEADKYARIALAYGIKKGDSVALMMENRPEFFGVWFGMLKIGAVTALINTEAKTQAVTHAVTTVDSQLVFVGSECMTNYLTGDCLNTKIKTIEILDGENSQAIHSNESGLITLAQAESFSADTTYTKSARQGLKNSDNACYIFTSGTTGLPKAAYITHSKWLSTGHRWLAQTDLQPDDIFYCVLPLYHGAGLMSLYSTVMALGASSVLRRKFSVSNFWRDVATHNVTCSIYVGEICRYLLAVEPSEHDKNHNLRILFGAGMGVDIWEQFQQRFGQHIRIYEGWGSTESNCNMTNVENTPGSCGRIPYWDKTFMRMVKYSIEDDDYVKDKEGFCLEASSGEVGELLGQVHDEQGNPVSPFDGYTDAAATEKKLLRNVFKQGDCWFSTGDLFRYDDEGYFYFVDRLGDTYRWKSENVSTTEVVHQLSSYEDAELINVYGVKVPNTEGRAGMAAIVLKENKQFDPDVFYRLAEQNLPPYAMPLFVRIMTAMDMTGSFKLRKVDLQKMGYNPNNFQDELFLLDTQSKIYAPYSEEGLEKLGLSPFEQ